jgi:hypothetical protein
MWHNIISLKLEWQYLLDLDKFIHSTFKFLKGEALDSFSISIRVHVVSLSLYHDDFYV